MVTPLAQIATLCIIGIILTLPLHSLSRNQNIDPEIRSRIENFIRNVYLPATTTSTLGLAIVQNDGEVLYSTGYGYADQDKSIPNGNETQFLIGSLTKSFTAAVVIKVLSEKFSDLGEKVLDTPIRKLLPSANFTLNDRFRSEHTTFRDLLAHRTCIVKNGMSLFADPFETPKEITYRLRYSEEICGIRSEYQYNNQMYVLAGELAAELSNLSYEELSDQYSQIQDFLTDLGMTNSSLTRKSDDFPNMPFRAMPYYVMDNTSHPFNTNLIKRVTNFNAAGGLYATPDDMARYMRFHLNLGSLDDNQIIPEDVMMMMSKPSMVLAPFDFKTSDGQRIVNYMAYGLGLFIVHYDGWQYINHAGYFPPYNSLMSLFQEKKVAIFTSSNQGPVLMDPTVLHTFIYDTLTGVSNATEKALERIEKLRVERARKISKRDDAVAKFMQKSKTAKEQNEDIVGKYGSGSSGDIEIFEKFNNQTNTTGIYLSYGRWAQAWLENISGANYRLIWDSDIIQDYYVGGDPTGTTYASINNGTLEILSPQGDNLVSMGKFELGVSLENLPSIPWTPESCGPE